MIDFSFRMPITNLWYLDKEIPLDGYHFINCRFENCTLTYKLGNFELTGCYHKGSIHNYVGKPLEDIIQENLARTPTKVFGDPEPVSLSDDLVGISDIADLAFVSRAAVFNWTRRHADFPKPLATLKCGPIFYKSQVMPWIVRWQNRTP